MQDASALSRSLADLAGSLALLGIGCIYTVPDTISCVTRQISGVKGPASFEAKIGGANRT